MYKANFLKSSKGLVYLFLLPFICYTNQLFGLEFGCDQHHNYLPLLKGKRVAVVANHTSLLSSGEHLVDFLVKKGVDIKYIMPPEHGFRGDADAGESIKDGKDSKTSIEVISLYGANKEPAQKYIEQIDILLYDLQDVGVRFYTYISTMHYAMEACAKGNKKMIILDRPNPNGSWVDGPLRDKEHKSFVGIYPIPVVYGLTAGELALMAIDKGWSRKCELKVVKCSGYNHNILYQLKVNPSPNLKDMNSIYLYPSTCYFEGTVMSLGRGTATPFKLYGHPDMKNCNYSFTPRSMSGATNPPHKDVLCYGKDLSHLTSKQIISRGINLSYVVEAYENIGGGEKFFLPIFNLLTGVDYVKKMIIEGKSYKEIEAVWKEEVASFKQERKKYLLYE